MKTTITENHRKYVKMAELEVRNRSLEGTKYVLQRDESRWLLAGRSQAADIHIPDETVSEQHFRLQMRGSAVVLLPLATTNGTFVGPNHGRARVPPMSEIMLDDSASFFAGKVRFRLRWCEEERVPFATQTNLGGRLFGVSDLMRRLFSKIVRLAESPADVLITGEIGTGKDETAKLIHECSQRADRPFVKVGCTELALNERLADITIFGHERTPGLIEAAEGGVVYIDGVEWLSYPLQAKLAALMDSRCFRGFDGVERTVNCRLVLSTSRTFCENSQGPRLSPELFHRVGARLTIPPLRQRLSDISILAPLFVEQASDEFGRELMISQDGIEYLERLPWTGNVLELKQFIRSAAIMGEDLLSAESFEAQEHTKSEIADFERLAGLMLSQAVSSEISSNDAKQEIGDSFMRACLRILIPKHGRNPDVLAKVLGVTARTIRNQLGSFAQNDQFELV